MKEAKISQNRQNKVDLVTALRDKFTKSKILFFADFRGLKHQQLEQLRKALKKVQGEFIIAKNTLIKLALSQSHKDFLKDLETHLKEPTAILLSFGDQVSTVKELAAFIKSNQLPKIKTGIFENKLASASDFNQLATLPSRNELISLLCLRIKSPMYGLHFALSNQTAKLVYALNAVAKTKK